MRILVTKLGDELVKVMVEENMTLTKFNTTTDNKQFTENKNLTIPLTHTKNKSNLSNKNGLNNSINKSNHSKLHGDLHNKLEQDQTRIASDDFVSSKIISIKQKRLNIPKNVTERYNSDNKASFILPSVTLPKFRETINTNFTSSNNFMNFDTTKGINSVRNTYTFRDVLEDNTYKDLKKRLNADKKMKDRLSRIDETKFRSVYGEKNSVEKLDEMLGKNINTDRINLINFLNKKKDVSDVLIKRLSEYSEDKINKVNKICQIVFFNEERSQIYKERINERIQAKKNRENTEYKTSIEEMGDNMKSFGNILKDYERSCDKRERFRDIHNDVVNKFWKKYQVNRFDKNSNRSRSQSIIDDLSNFNVYNLNKQSNSSKNDFN
jgi:hypothetical protein